MGEMRIDPTLPDWVQSGKPLFIKEVAEITSFSPWYLLELRKQGRIRAILNAKPYRFDPKHIYAVFFQNLEQPVAEKPKAVSRSLKIERLDKSVSHKPVSRGDLWQD